MTYPTHRPHEERDRAYLLEVAAAATESAPPGEPPAVWNLLGDSSHIEDIMTDYQRVADELIAARNAHQVDIFELERLRRELVLATALNSATVAITSRSAAEVSAQLDAEMAAHPGEELP